MRQPFRDLYDGANLALQNIPTTTLALQPAAAALQPVDLHHDAMEKWLTKLYASDGQLTLTQRDQLLLANSTAMHNSTSIDISQRTTTTHS